MKKKSKVFKVDFNKPTAVRQLVKGGYSVYQGGKRIGCFKAVALKDARLFAGKAGRQMTLMGVGLIHTLEFDSRETRHQVIATENGPMGTGGYSEWLIHSADLVLFDEEGVRVSYFYGDRRPPGNNGGELS